MKSIELTPVEIGAVCAAALFKSMEVGKKKEELGGKVRKYGADFNPTAYAKEHGVDGYRAFVEEAKAALQQEGFSLLYTIETPSETLDRAIGYDSDEAAMKFLNAQQWGIQLATITTDFDFENQEYTVKETYGYPLFGRPIDVDGRKIEQQVKARRKELLETFAPQLLNKF